MFTRRAESKNVPVGCIVGKAGPCNFWIQEYLIHCCIHFDCILKCASPNYVVSFLLVAVYYFLDVSVDVTGRTKEESEIKDWVCWETGYRQLAY